MPLLDDIDLVELNDLLVKYGFHPDQFAVREELGINGIAGNYIRGTIEHVRQAAIERAGGGRKVVKISDPPRDGRPGLEQIGTRKLACRDAGDRAHHQTPTIFGFVPVNDLGAGKALPVEPGEPVALPNQVRRPCNRHDLGVGEAILPSVDAISRFSGSDGHPVEPSAVQ
jgi:hypothetical protein